MYREPGGRARRAGAGASRGDTALRGAANVSRYPTTTLNRRGGTGGGGVGHLVHNEDTGAHTGPVPERLVLSSRVCVPMCAYSMYTRTLRVSVFKVLNSVYIYTLSTKFLVSRGRQNLGRGVQPSIVPHTR